MKKVVFLACISLISIACAAQTGGIGWQQVTTKQNFTDTINIVKAVKLNGTRVTVSATDLNKLAGLGPGTVESRLQSISNISTFNTNLTGTTTIQKLKIGSAIIDSMSNDGSGLKIYMNGSPVAVYVPIGNGISNRTVNITRANNVPIPALPAGAIADTTLVLYHDSIFYVTNTSATYPNYYVKNGGDDSKSGLDDANAWAHHPWMSTWTGSVTLTAGSVVNMKRGDTWSSSSTSAPYMEVAQSGTSGRPIITTAYGSGAKPVIKFTVTTNYPVIEGLGKAYITFDNLDIQNASSTRSINYEANGINFGKDGSSNLPHDWIITNCAIHNCSRTGIEGLDDAYNITIGNINTTSTATTSVFNNEIYNCGYAGIILCGRNSATSRSDLNVYGNYIHNIDYNASAAEDGVGVSFTSESINGSGEGYSTGWPSYCTAKYNYISNVPGGVGVDGHGGTYIYFQNNYVKDCRIGIMQQAADRVYAESAILDHGYIENNIIENTGAAITGSNHAFIYTVAENVAKRATNCYVRYNTLFYTTRPATETGAMGVGFYNVNGLTIDGNYVYNGPTGAAGGGIAESASGNSKSVIIQNNYIVNWSESIYLSAGHIDGTVAVNSNIVRSHLIPFHIDDGTVVSGGIVSLYNNTLLTSNASSPCHAVDMGGITLASGSSVTIKDNIIGGTVTNAYTIYVFGPATVTGTFACNYNLYWNSTRSNPYYVSGGGNTFAAWQALTYDANSFNNTDPLFTNGGGSYNLASDFALQAGSPALDVGINTGVTLDYYGNARNGNYDLGAVEKQ